MGTPVRFLGITMDIQTIGTALGIIGLAGAGITVTGSSMAFVRHLLFKASGGIELKELEYQKEIEIARAVNTHALPPQSQSLNYSSHYAPHISQHSAASGAGLNGDLGAIQSGGQGDGDLFRAICDTHHSCFFGASGSGKTMLVNELVEREWAKNSDTFIVDIDNYPGKWHKNCHVFKETDEMSELDSSVVGQMSVLVKQRHDIHNRSGAIPKRKLHLVIDEAHEVLAGCPNIMGFFEKMVKRGRKLGVSLTIITTDGQMGSLNLKGKTELLKNMKRVDLAEANGKRWATIDGTRYLIPEITRDLPLLQESLPQTTEAAYAMTAKASCSV